MSPLPAVVSWTLPLSMTQLDSALRTGHGRALLHVQKHHDQATNERVLYACLNNLVYDSQCEGTRTPWLVELMEASGDSAHMADLFLSKAGTHRPGRATWDLGQQVELLAHYVRGGEPRARSVLYNMVQVDPDGDIVGDSELVELDGPVGLLHIARTVGARLIEGALVRCVNNGTVFGYDSIHGHGAAEELLRTAAREDARVACYIDAYSREIQADRARPAPDRGDLTRLTPWEVADRIGRDKNFRATGWGQTASETGRAQFAALTLEVKDAHLLPRYFSAFHRCRFPFFDRRLFDLAQHADRHIRECALEALGTIDHAEVRSFALDGILQGNHERVLALDQTYAEGDWKKVRDNVQRSDDEYEFHSLLYELVGQFEKRNTDDCPEAMLFVYEYTPCMNCRGRAVKKLLALDALPAWAVEECRVDGDTEIREAVSLARR